MNLGAIHVQIERLVLRGLSYSRIDQQRLQAAVERELSQILTRAGSLPAGGRNSGALGRDLASVARQIAAGIHQQVTPILRGTHHESAPGRSPAPDSRRGSVVAGGQPAAGADVKSPRRPRGVAPR